MRGDLIILLPKPNQGKIELSFIKFLSKYKNLIELSEKIIFGKIGELRFDGEGSCKFWVDLKVERWGRLD